MSEVYSSFGVKFQRKTGTSTFEEVPRIEDVTPPSFTVQMEEFKTHDSPNGETEFRPAFITTGPVTVKFKFDPADAKHTALETDAKAKTKNTYKVILPITPAKGWTFDAYISEWKPGNLGTDGFVEVEITLTTTGGYTFGATA